MRLVEEPFEWDQANTSHLARHRITPAEAEYVVRSDPHQIDLEVREGELRRTEIGETQNRRILIVITTARGYNIRVVTAWDAGRAAQTEWRNEKEARIV